MEDGDMGQLQLTIGSFFLLHIYRYLEKNKSELNHQPSTSATASTSSTVRHRNKSCMETTVVESASSSSSGSGSSGSNLSKLNPSLSPSHHQQRLSVEQQQPLDEVQQLDHSDSSF